MVVVDPLLIRRDDGDEETAILGAAEENSGHVDTCRFVYALISVPETLKPPLALTQRWCVIVEHVGQNTMRFCWCFALFKVVLNGSPHYVFSIDHF